MLKFLNLNLICLFFTSQILFAEPNSDLNDITFYSELRELFEIADLPETTQMTGWRSGRCFSKDYPDTGIANILIGLRDVGEGPMGPMFKFRSYQKSLDEGYPGDYFDTLAVRTINALDSYVEKNKAFWRYAKIYNHSLIGGEKDILEEFRFANNSIIHKISKLGETVYYCYASKKQF